MQLVPWLSSGSTSSHVISDTCISPYTAALHLLNIEYVIATTLTTRIPKLLGEKYEQSPGDGGGENDDILPTDENIFLTKIK